MSPECGKKNVSTESIAKKALKDKKTLSEVLERVLRDDPKDHGGAVKYECLKALLALSEDHPEVLYPHWDWFVELLSHDNAYLKYLAIHAIGNLAKVDTKNKFAKTFNEYYKLLENGTTIVPAHVAGNSGKIARANPKLQSKITNELFEYG